MFQIVSVLVIILGLTVIIPMIENRLKDKNAGFILWAVFVAYCLGNLYFTVLSRKPGITQQFELIPFNIYGRLFEELSEEEITGTGFAAKFLYGAPPVVGLILNILLYYPLGYLLPILFPKLKPKHIILIGCLCSIVTEATQYLLKMGWCETDDVIHNTLGTALGVWVWHLQSRRLNKPKTNELPKE